MDISERYDLSSARVIDKCAGILDEQSPDASVIVVSDVEPLHRAKGKVKKRCNIYLQLKNHDAVVSWLSLLRNSRMQSQRTIDDIIFAVETGS
jgi:hypothetical protein